MSETFRFAADELLRLYLGAESAAECAEFLDSLVENHALPVIEKSLRAKFHSSFNNGFYLSDADFEDLCGESCLRLVEKLVALRNDADAKPIRDFNGYAAVIAFNVWNEFLNDGAPNRKSLKNKIRYALGKSGEFEVWRENDEIYGSLISHKQRIKEVSPEDLTIRVEKEFADFRNAALPDLIFEILEKANSALKLNDLTAIVARLWAIEDVRDVSLEDFRENNFSAEANRQSIFEMRFKLEQIWQEIRALPVNQRVALLYNLRDERGREMLFMFFNHKIASLREISEAMNLSLEDCAKVFPFLPLEDKAIAEKMNLTAKQVGNLRKVARENLRRRLAGKPKRQRTKEEDYFARETREIHEKKK